MPNCGTPACFDEKCQIAFGLCHCGCGEKAPVSERTHTQFNWKKDQPKKFVFGHMLGGSDAPNWRGGRQIVRGYVKIYVGHDHPMADANGNCFEHRLVMAKKLGRMLSGTEVVHHRNDKRDDNRLENLELLADRNTHKRVYHSRLDPDKVRGIRAMLTQGVPHASIAAEYDVCQATISNVNTGKCWSHIT